MAITLDPATEQRIQRELDRGRFSSPAEVIAEALDLLEAENDWLDISKHALSARLEESMAQIDRGEGIPRRSAPAGPRPAPRVIVQR